MLFDLGALQLCSYLNDIILITCDKFGQSAKACFENNYIDLHESNNNGIHSDEQRNTDFHQFLLET